MSDFHKVCRTLRLLAVAAGIGVGGASANVPSPQPFSEATVTALAADLAKRPFVPAAPPPASATLDYDGYRDVRFKPEKAIWRGTGSPFELHLLPAGWLYKEPITLSVVEGGVVRDVVPSADMFEVGAQAASLAGQQQWRLSGFRINGELNTPGHRDEIMVFQGASYFRALSRGQSYGLSARGLAIGSGEADEEFPVFRHFWVERPGDGAAGIVVHALMDGPSATGAYRFVVRPGAPTRIDVDAVLYPRRPLANIGLAPLTSMHLLSPMERMRVSDFRPRVHDSDGLAIHTGKGERLWRPLANPHVAETGHFIDDSPRGFGLIQRFRNVEGYLDYEAHYERRPSAWVEPRGEWGRGSVVLVELPTEEEIHDNIVAFWRPEKPLAPGVEHRFAYTLSWPDRLPMPPAMLVARSLMGKANGHDGIAGKMRFAIDFDGLDTAAPLPVATVATTVGKISHVTVQRLGDTAMVRVAFLLEPAEIGAAELRVALNGTSPLNAETWLYRWTRDP